ncbi:MAG: orotidine-5'-phosphate decarboxylase [Microgenomates group bacterium]
MNIYSKLNSIIDKNNSLVCVGLDSAIEKIPSHLQNERYPQFAFNKAIIDATTDFVCAYKPNSAFYEARGEAGMKELKMTFDYIHNNYPDVVTILDAKRADIGSTNEGYVKYIFDYLGVDCVTLHPYLGKEALQPFLKREDKGSIILCRTSNPGSGEFQDLSVGDVPLYMHVAQVIAERWNANNNCMLVVGATYPEEMKKIRAVVKNMPFLVPGIGAQGGDVEKTVKAGIDENGRGMIINSARGIIFSSGGKDCAIAAKNATMKLRDDINKQRTI